MCVGYDTVVRELLDSSHMYDVVIVSDGCDLATLKSLLAGRQRRWGHTRFYAVQAALSPSLHAATAYDAVRHVYHSTYADRRLAASPAVRVRPLLKRLRIQLEAHGGASYYEFVGNQNYRSSFLIESVAC